MPRVRFNYQKSDLNRPMIPRRVVVLVIAIVAVLAAAITGYIYLASLSSVNSGAKPVVTTINIPQGSYIEPSGFRSEERRVGKECRSRWSSNPEKKKTQQTL